MSIQRTVNGITYNVVSPSFWQLQGQPIEIAYVELSWVLFCPDKQGEPMARQFKSLRAAQELIEGALGIHP